MNREAAARAIDAFLRALGRDPEHEPELAGTGARVAPPYADELLAGYAVDVDALLAQNVFAGTSELVVVRDVPVATTCPHHLMPATGTATVGVRARTSTSSASGPSRASSTRFARRLALAGADRRAGRRGAAEAPGAALGGVPHRAVARLHDRARRAGRTARASRRVALSRAATSTRRCVYAALGVGR